jgi:hypothetical protein
MDPLALISTPTTMLATHFTSRALSCQGKDFPPAMQPWVLHLTRHLDEERKHHQAVSTSKPTWRTAQGLDSGAITVQSMLAASRQPGHTMAPPAAPPRGTPEERAAVHLPPVLRADGRTKHGAGQRVGGEPRRPSLLETQHAALPPVPLWRTLQRGGWTSGTGQRRAALQARADVVLARRRSLRQHRAHRTPDGSLQRPEVSLAATFVQQHHAGLFPWYLDEDGPWVNTPSGKGPRLSLVHAMTAAGWVPGAALVVQAATRTGTDQGPRHGEHVSTWCAEPWRPPLPARSLILLAKAPDHQVVVEAGVPTPQRRHEQLWAWLTRTARPWTPER